MPLPKFGEEPNDEHAPRWAMSLRSWLTSKGTVQLRPEQRDSTVTQLAELQGYRLRTTAGVGVTDHTALTHSAVWSCVDLISEIVSTLPVHEYRIADGRLVKVPTPPPLLDDPAGDGYGFEVWSRSLLVSALLRGNMFGWIERLGADGWPVQIATLSTNEITCRRDRNGGPVEWYRENKLVQRWPDGPLWHVPAYTVPGSPVGLAPLTYAAETIGLGLAAMRYDAEWFTGGGLPLGTFETDQPLTDTQAEAIKSRVTGSLAERGVMVLGYGNKFNAMQVSPQDSQFLETIKANADDVAKFFFRRPPGEGGSVTYANVEARSLDLLTYTLTGWMVRLEKALTRLRPRPRVVKFNADAFLRVDSMTRAKVIDMQVRGGVRSRDEVREKDDYAPIPDGTGGEFLWPPYATSLGGDASDGPPQPARPGT
jgi:HK97 family phage portal protein